MGKKLGMDVVAHRMINKLNLRQLARTGKCKLCKAVIKGGDWSLRHESLIQYTGSMSEIGICLNCAKEVFPLIEKIVGEISVKLDEIAGSSQEE